MKRIITILASVTVLLGLAVPAQASIPVPGIVPVEGCVFTARYNLAFDNGLAWSTSDNNAFHTPMFRAGSCRGVIVISFGVYNAPACFWAKVKTYNEDRSTRVNGPWYQFRGVGTLGNLRSSIDSGRLHRVYVYGCEPYRGRQFPPSFELYSH